jgi:uncharacterized protein
MNLNRNLDARSSSMSARLSPSARTARIPSLGFLVLSVVSLCLIYSPRASSAARPDIEGHWEGAIQIPGTALDIKVDLALAGDAWSGTIDIPIQGATALPLTGIAVTGNAIKFAIKNIPGDPTFDGSLAEGKISGTFTQGGQEIPFVLGRDKKAPPPRPQEPKPPFPYKSEEVSFANGPIKFAGTLTIPDGKGPFPAALLLSGSGAQDRDEAIFGHKPFLVLADHLSRAGIAVLRVDDRGVGGSTGDLSRVTNEDLKDDALAALKTLKGRPEIDPKRIGLIGHSEGGLTAPLAASQSRDVAFIVLMAAPGVPGDSILTRQLKAQYRAGGVPDDRMRPAIVEHLKFLELIKQNADSVRLGDQARKMIIAQTAAQGNQPEPSKEQLDQVVASILHEVASPWLRSFIQYDPRPALAKVKVPVLVLSGDKDLQVDPAQNIPEIEKPLAEAGNKDVTIHRFPGLNHLFQTAQTGSLMEYAQIEETINPPVLQAIQEWILARSGKK